MATMYQQSSSQWATAANNLEMSSEAKMMEHQENCWIENYNELQEFQASHGNCRVPKGWKENPSLSRWVRQQRRQNNLKLNGEHSKLTDAQEDMLDDVGFEWDVYKAVWEDGFSELLEFHQENGHCIVPTVYRNDRFLWKWIWSQREQYSLLMNHKQSNMTRERMERLASIGFTWTAPAHVHWEDQFSELFKFHQKFGHCNVPTTYNDDCSLGSWVKKQRWKYSTLKNHKQSNRTRERMKKLDSIGFDGATISPRNGYDVIWEGRFSELLEYQQKSGHCNVPTSYKNDRSLASWVKKQRWKYSTLKNHKQSNRTRERMKKLESIGFIWTMNNEQSSDRIN